MRAEVERNPLIVRGKCRRFGCAFIDQISLERTSQAWEAKPFLQRYSPPPPSRLASACFPFTKYISNST